MKKIIFTVMAMAGILLMAGCPNGSTEEDVNSSEKYITGFKFLGADNHAALPEDVEGSITGNDITLTVPYGTTLTDLKPTISFSDEASVNPASGTAVDFNNPVTYTVTAQDGTTRNYTITVNVAPPNTGKSITSFKFEADNNDALSEDVPSSINGNVITLTVPHGTALTALKPAISFSDEASVNPASGTAMDFSNPVTYTVTAQDGTTRNYTVTVNVELPGITLNFSGEQDDESVTASHEKANSGTQITLTANNLGAGRKVALSASGINISPAVVIASGGTATFTMPDTEVTVTATFSNLEAGYAVEHTADAVSFGMHYVPGGTFEMGYTGVAEPVHTVTLTKDFWMGETEVTQGLWEAVWGNEWPGNGPTQESGDGDNYPAYEMDWYDAAAFCNELTKADDSINDEQQVYYSDEALTIAYTKENGTNHDAIYPAWDKKGYRLPTEAEWEYAARYINGTSWNGGDHVSGDTSEPYNTSAVIGNYAWYDGNNGSSGTPDYGSKEVGQKTANALGLKDMSGNVWEWCYDRKADYDSSPQSDPHGADSGDKRVRRGGGWNQTSDNLQLGFRRDYKQTHRYKLFGFRLCKTAD